MNHKSSFGMMLRENSALFLLAAGWVGMHVLLNGQYGFHRDELDMLMNARQLDWGYVAYPPLAPFIARISLELFGPMLTGMRLFPALCQGVVILLVGWMARDFGARRAGQLAAGLAAAIAPVALVAGTLIQYMSFDYLWWVLAAFCFVRLLKTEDPRWWLGVGAAIGLGMMTKFTMAFFTTALAAAVLLTPTRRYLRSPWLWAGAGLAVLLYLPNLVWQMQHQFISLDFLSAIHARDIEWGRTDEFLPEQLYVAASPFMLPVWIAGLIYCLFNPGAKRFRAVGWMYLAVLTLLFVSRGRAYYVGPAYAMLVAAGTTWWEGWISGRGQTAKRLGAACSWILLGLGTAVGVVLVKPIAPINSAVWNITSNINGEVVEMVGWEDLTAQVAGVYATLPKDEKAQAVILAGNYGEAGALDLYGDAYGLPAVISGANSLWERGYGDSEPQTVILVGFDLGYAARYFRNCKYAGQVRNRFGVKNEESKFHTSLYVCGASRQPWAEMWQEMRWFQ